MFWSYWNEESNTDGITIFYNYGTKQFSSVIFAEPYVKLLSHYESDSLIQSWYILATGQLCGKVIYHRQDNNEGLSFHW